MEIRSSGPLIDYLIEFAREYIVRGKVDIHASYGKVLIGSVLDAEYGARHFLPKNRIKAVELEESGLELKIDVQTEKCLTSMRFNKEQYLLEQPALARAKFIILENKETGDKISVSSRASNKAAYNPLINRIKSRRGLPMPMNKIAIGFRYHGPSNLYVRPVYMHTNPFLCEVSEKSKNIYYPCSRYERYMLEKDVWDFFAKPLFWSGWGEWNVIALQILAGKRIEEEVAGKYGRKGIKHLKKSQNLVWEIINKFGDDGEVSAICETLKCPVEFRDYFLRGLLRGLNYYINKNTLDPANPLHEYGKNIVNACSIDFEKAVEDLEKIRLRHQSINAF